jgi:hypothetical protein
MYPLFLLENLNSPHKKTRTTIWMSEIDGRGMRQVALKSKQMRKPDLPQEAAVLTQLHPIQ